MKQAEAEAMCTEMLPFARAIIREQRRKYPRQLAAEVVSAGWLGLWRACLRYDPARGCPKASWVKTHIVSGIVNALRVHCGRNKGDEKHPTRSAAVQLDWLAWRKRPVCRAFPSPFQSACEAQQRAQVRRILAGLPERETYVLREKYFRGRNQADIARSLHIGEARVTDLHALALEHARAIGQNRPW